MPTHARDNDHSRSVGPIGVVVLTIECLTLAIFNKGNLICAHICEQGQCCRL